MGKLYMSYFSTFLVNLSEICEIVHVGLNLIKLDLIVIKLSPD